MGKSWVVTEYSRQGREARVQRSCEETGRTGRDGESQIKAHSPGKESRPYAKGQKLLNYF